MLMALPDMTETLEKLYFSGLAFLSPLTPEETYVKIVEEAKKLTGASYGTILLMKKERLTRVYTSLPIELKSTSRPRGFSFNAFSTGEPLIVGADKILPHHPELKKIKLKASVMIPLCYYHQAIGVLILAMTKRKTIRKKQLQLMKLFGAMTTLSIQKTQLYKEAKQALETQDIFISMAAHELRTPLTAMNAYTHLLKKKLESQSGPEAQWVHELYQETTLLTRLINELLHVDLLKSGKFTFSKHVIDAKDIVERTIRQFHVSFPYSRLVFHNKITHGQSLIEADADRIIQMLQNILENAAKFSPPEKEITITLLQEEKYVIVTILDKGIGIAKKDIPNMSHMFYKEKENYKEGMGLGLYISKVIADEHHGSIQITSLKQKGTSVRVALPRVDI